MWCCGMTSDAVPIDPQTRRALVWWWMPVGLLLVLLAALILVAAIGWHELFVPYPNSVWLPACGNTWIASGAPSAPGAAAQVYFYTQVCFLTQDTPDQVDTWYRQRGWQYLPPAGTVRLASWQLGVLEVNFQQTAFTRVAGSTTTVHIGYVVNIRPTWP